MRSAPASRDALQAVVLVDGIPSYSGGVEP